MSLISKILKNKKFLTRSGIFLFLYAFLIGAQEVYSHGVAAGDKGFIEEVSGEQFMAFVYLGAKHMVTGYDHLLFIFGLIFFLYKMKDIAIYVTLFTVGHIITLLGGVYFDINANSHIIDAIIGLSVAYKALDNMGAYQRWFNFQPNTKVATLIFGLVHGFGLATRLQEFELAPDGLLFNLLSFNLGVEIGQILALAVILIAMSAWRKTSSFWKHAYTANVILLVAGLLLMGYQITGYIINL